MFPKPLFTQRSAHRQTYGLVLLLLLFPFLCHTQTIVSDIAKESISYIPKGMTSLNVAIHDVRLGMSWGEARNIFEHANVPYFIQKGSSPIVFVPPENSTYYFVLHPSSYDIIEMGIIGVSDLPLENQFLFDGQRWRLTTARTQFFDNEGESIVNEEAESYNFPYQGFVLKYLTPENFRFIMVAPTNKPLTTSYGYQPDAPPDRRHADNMEREIRITDESGKGKRVEKQIQVIVKDKDEEEEAPATGADAELNKGKEVFNQKNYSEALKIFRHTAATAKDPLLRQRAEYWMGEAYFGLKQYQPARKQFIKVRTETSSPSLKQSAQRMINRIYRVTKKK
jgi:hypothetical protein